jgi:hypothetical protein
MLGVTMMRAMRPSSHILARGARPDRSQLFSVARTYSQAPEISDEVSSRIKDQGLLHTGSLVGGSWVNATETYEVCYASFVILVSRTCRAHDFGDATMDS